MDDMMLELTAGNHMLRRRLDAYADARLSPDPATAARMRARVMAAAHRQAALSSAGAGLTVITATSPATRRRGPARRAATRTAAILLAAALGLSLAVGSAFAADAGGLLYPARLGLETLLLPSDPSERAIAELARLEARLQEAQAASERGDVAAVGAAMEAYEVILQTASAAAIRAGDAVATAALEAGVHRNVEVLQAILEHTPAAAGAGLTRAIERSGETIDDIHGAAGGNGPGGTPTGGPGDDPTPTSDRTPRPTKEPTAVPTPKATPTPDRTPKPDRTAKPDKTPPGQPSDPGTPGDGSQGDQGGG